MLGQASAYPHLFALVTWRSWDMSSFSSRV